MKSRLDDLDVQFFGDLKSDKTQGCTQRMAKRGPKDGELKKLAPERAGAV